MSPHFQNYGMYSIREKKRKHLAIPTAPLEVSFTGWVRMQRTDVRTTQMSILIREK
eukprot:COSAG02_NODE_32254_length_519_cov_0.885714_1_plen_55_part_01